LSAAAPFAAVLRLSGFSLSQADLEARLNVRVERYSLDKGGYVQLVIEKDELDWAAIEAFLQRHGAAVKTLRDGGDVQSACLDLAYNFREGLASMYRTIPAQTAALAGLHSIDVMFSVYLSTP
jgi:hypothetical protein